ncbi:MAG TPA: divalent metal cation transporter [Terriglobales bacterium]|nr:divalent metal cation transporter [Terriglobales bacterium]
MALLTERRTQWRSRRRWPRHFSPSVKRALGLSLVTGAADDDPSAIGTYTTVGARLGWSALWMAPALVPMMAVIVYLAAKLGQVTGQGLGAIVRDHCPRIVLYGIMTAVVCGNTIEAAADLGGLGAATNLLLPIPLGWLVVGFAAAVLAIQMAGSYVWMRSIFRWLAMALLAYIGAALLARPDLAQTVRGTLLPHLRWDHDSLLLLVAVIGTSLSPYLYVWQASQEVEEHAAKGLRRREDRAQATARDLRFTAWDVILGMVFSNLVMYFIILAAAATLFRHGIGNLTTAAEVARALRPLAGHAAGALFALGVIGVGVLALPVMSAGAAYMVCDAMGWKNGLGSSPQHAPQFYAVVTTVMVAAAALNFIGINPIHALIAAGVVQGLLAPALMLLIMLLTRRREVMGSFTNSKAVNILGWLTTVLATSAAVALILG